MIANPVNSSSNLNNVKCNPKYQIDGGITKRSIKPPQNINM